MRGQRHRRPRDHPAPFAPGSTEEVEELVEDFKQGLWRFSFSDLLAVVFERWNRRCWDRFGCSLRSRCEHLLSLGGDWRRWIAATLATSAPCYP